MHAGSFLKRIRESNKVTQTELGEIAGWKQPEVANIENKENITVKTIDRYLKALLNRDIQEILNDGLSKR